MGTTLLYVPIWVGAHGMILKNPSKVKSETSKAKYNPFSHILFSLSCLEPWPKENKTWERRIVISSTWFWFHFILEIKSFWCLKPGNLENQYLCSLKSGKHSNLQLWTMTKSLNSFSGFGWHRLWFSQTTFQTLFGLRKAIG